MGRGTARSAVEGQFESASPSTMLRMVPLPIRFADREDWMAPPRASAPRRFPFGIIRPALRAFVGALEVGRVLAGLVGAVDVALLVAVDTVEVAVGGGL